MDDGALKGQNRSGKRLHTEGFKKDEVELLCRAMNNIGIKTNVHKQTKKVNGEPKTYYILYITAEGDPVFTKMIEPYIIPQMQYKVKPTKLHKR